ncbi:putative P-loop containing nucleoside triphosphate hydrolase [Septoria linicola]|nr:putative P-loop containing nucleoside triphosphate hydrolase [Septoria linicola]
MAHVASQGEGLGKRKRSVDAPTIPGLEQAPCDERSIKKLKPGPSQVLEADTSRIAKASAKQRGVRKERFSAQIPMTAGLHPNRGRTENKVSGACKTLVSHYESAVQHNVRNRALDNHMQDVYKLMDPAMSYPVHGPIYLLGSMGSGKSTSLSMLLGIDGVALTSSGSRGTNVAHEYRGLDEEQRKSGNRFIVHIHYLSDEEIKTNTKDYVTAIIAYMDTIHAKEVFGEEVDESELKLLKVQYSSALKDLLDVLYNSNSDSFDTAQHLAEWIEAMESGVDAVTTSVMKEIRDYKRTMGATELPTIRTAKNVNELKVVFR